MLELRRLADRGIQHLHTASKAVGLESSRACWHTEILIVEEIRLAPSLANSIDVRILAKLAIVGSGTPSTSRIEFKPLDAVATVLC